MAEAAEAMSVDAGVATWDAPRVLAWLVSVNLAHLGDKCKCAAVTGKDLLEAKNLAETLALGEADGAALQAALEKLRAAEGRVARAPSVDDFICQICMEMWVRPVTVACGHTFCRDCLTNWLLKNPSCPTDRRELPRDLPAVNVALWSLTEKSFPAEAQARVTRTAAAGRAVEAEAERRALELQRARDEAAARERTQKVERLTRHFRGHGVTLDVAAMKAVLDVCDGSVENAIAFLELQGEAPADFVDVRNVGTGNTAPPDYMRLPPAHTFAPIPAVAPAHTLQGLVDCFLTGETPLAHTSRPSVAIMPRMWACCGCVCSVASTCCRAPRPGCLLLPGPAATTCSPSGC